MTNEGTALGQHGGISVHEIGEVGQLLAETRISKQGPDAAFHIDPRV